MREALFYEPAGGLKVRCTLCPHRCSILPGETGICGVRKNEEGRLVALTFSLVSSLNLDPIEKKPLYHFYPGGRILSIGSYGCNLQCRFCQNHEISQCRPEQIEEGIRYDPAEVASLAAKTPNNIGIAYTYNEPLIAIETILEIGSLVHRLGLKNVLVTNGYVNPAPLEMLLPLVDAWNIDLKGFSDGFYHHLTASRLAPVKETLKRVRAFGSHLEVTNLVIPGSNDDEELFEHMVEWMAGELGKNTVLHLSRYFPKHRLSVPPTPEHTLLRLYEIARGHLDFVFLGNILTPAGQDTFCPSCHALLISRTAYKTEVKGLAPDGTCRRCSTPVTRHFTPVNG
jgi:pyruvate formate lyase activating enzyme